MEHAVHGRHVGEERLGRADVGGGLLATDMLLACLQGHSVRATPVDIEGDANESPGHLPDIRVARGKKCRVGSAVTKRHAKPLRAAYDDICARLAGRSDHCQRKQVRAYGNQRAGVMGALRDRAHVDEGPVVVRCLEVDAEHVSAKIGRPRVFDTQCDAERRCPGFRVAHALVERRAARPRMSTVRRACALGPAEPSPRRLPSPRRGATRSQSAFRSDLRPSSRG